MTSIHEQTQYMLENGGRDDEDEIVNCNICGSMMEHVDCHECGGEGGFHDCGEDCCCCLHPENCLNERCGICDGDGGYLECPNVGKHEPAAQPRKE